MEFNEFRDRILKELQDFYGKDAEVSAVSVLKNNGMRCEGICIFYESSKKRIYPTIYLESLYRDYCNNDKTFEKCVAAIVELREEYEADDKLMDFAADILCWENVKHHIYPALLSAEKNKELLQGLVCRSFLDMAVIYMIREEFGEKGYGHVMIPHNMLRQYGISEKKLHNRAMRNLEKEGYCFRSMREVLAGMLPENIASEGRFTEDHIFKAGSLYILSNPQRLWGAAGLLNRKLLKRELGDRDYYIIPSSIHETIFMPVADDIDVEELNRMIHEVNETQVEVSERLSDHCYLWDGKNGMVRMCI